MLTLANSTVDAMRLMLPDNGALTVIDAIIGYAEKAVDAAEQMYKNHTIALDERNAKAVEIVYNLLQIAGIERTEAINKAVSEMIEAAVPLLPKTNAK